jgi:hypothetical protein
MFPPGQQDITLFYRSYRSIVIIVLRSSSRSLSRMLLGEAFNEEDGGDAGSKEEAGVDEG